MFSEPFNYITSVFRGIIGNNPNNEESREHEDQSSEQTSSRDFSRTRDNASSASAATQKKIPIEMQELNASKLRETNFVRDAEYEERVNEMLAEVTSRETGYSSDTDSYENISLGNEDTDDTVINRGLYERNSGPRHRNVSSRRVLSADEIQIEYDKSRDRSTLFPGKTKIDRGNNATSAEHAAHESKQLTPMKDTFRQTDSSDTHLKGASNRGFEDDEDEISRIQSEEPDVIRPLPNVASVSKIFMGMKPDRVQSANGEEGNVSGDHNMKLNEQSGVLRRRFSSGAEWKKLSQNKTMIASGGSTTSFLSTNPKVAEKLTQSYQRAKKRVSVTSKRPTFYDILRKVHAQKLARRLKSFIDHNADASYQFKQPKYYMRDSSSSDDEFVPRDPYSTVLRKRKWYERKPKSGTERLMQSRFFGKSLTRFYN